jgi:hypothetical protein
MAIAINQTHQKIYPRRELQIVNNSILPLRREQLRGPRRLPLAGAYLRARKRAVSTYVVADLRSAVSHILGGH